MRGAIELLEAVGIVESDVDRWNAAWLDDVTDTVRLQLRSPEDDDETCGVVWDAKELRDASPRP